MTKNTKTMLYTPEQKDLVVKNACDFGKFLTKNGFTGAWCITNQTRFTQSLADANYKAPKRQMSFVFLYHIIKKDYNYFKSVKNYDFLVYFNDRYNVHTRGVAGFTYFIAKSLMSLKTDDDVENWVNEIHHKIFVEL
jgi:hypothetical protein